MNKILKHPLFIILSSALLYAILDMINFKILAPGIYKNFMNKPFFNHTVKMVPGSLVYILVAAGLFYLFAPNYNWKKRSVFAFVLFGVYELTNLATIKGWPMDFTIYDWTWGFVAITLIAIYQKSLLK